MGSTTCQVTAGSVCPLSCVIGLHHSLVQKSAEPQAEAVKLSACVKQHPLAIAQRMVWSKQGCMFCNAVHCFQSPLHHTCETGCAQVGLSLPATWQRYAAAFACAMREHSRPRLAPHRHDWWVPIPACPDLSSGTPKINSQMPRLTGVAIWQDGVQHRVPGAAEKLPCSQ